MDPTYEPISEQVLTSNQSSVVFSNIPQGYKGLSLLISARTNRGDTGDAMLLQFNNDTGNNYSTRSLYGTGSSAVSAVWSNVSGAYLVQGACGNNDTANTFGSSQTYIPNYSSSTNKSISHQGNSETNASTSYMSADAGIWNNTSAISSIRLAPLNGTLFISGSSFQLYGIKNADDGGRGFFGPAVTGGDEVFTTGNGYKVHVFKNSGTLNVTAPGEVEYLVVGGGGGGGTGYAGGGGGAGGLRSSISGESGGGGSFIGRTLYLAPGSIPVIVGAGGAANASGSNSDLSSITSVGGGRGGTYQASGTLGGSGGGGGGNDATVQSGGAGTSSQGFAGGSSGSGYWYAGGGGGGAGAAGSNGIGAAVGPGETAAIGGAAGAGLSSNASGSSTTYGVGGNGSRYNGPAPSAGTTNRGNGGGGGGLNTVAGAAGGSGIVIIRYRI